MPNGRRARGAVKQWTSREAARWVPGGVGSLEILWAQRQLLTILLLLLLALAAVAFACDIKVIGSN